MRQGECFVVGDKIEGELENDDDVSMGMMTWMDFLVTSAFSVMFSVNE
jgi:hypothetical protein